MKKFVIYIENDDTIDSIIEKIETSPKYRNSIYLYLWADWELLFLKNLNLEIFVEKTQWWEQEIILVSTNIEIFKRASKFWITVQNVLEQWLNLPRIFVSKRRIWEREIKPRVDYSISNFNEKIEKINWMPWLRNKKEKIFSFYELNKKAIFPLFTWSMFLILIILVLILPNSKIYIEPWSKTIKTSINVIFAEEKTNKGELNESNRNIVYYRNIEKLYESEIIYSAKWKIFEWQNAKWLVLIENSFGETLALKKGTKFQTSDWLTFKSDFYINIPAWKKIKDENWKIIFKKWQARLTLTSNDYDIYREIIGSRWNITPWVVLTVPKLNNYIQKFIDITTINNFEWWTTRWRKSVTEEDITIAWEQIKASLFRSSEWQVLKLIEDTNLRNKENYKLFPDKNFLKIELSKVIVPKDIIWKSIESFIVTWSIVIKWISYDYDRLYSILENNIKWKIHPEMKLSFIDTNNILIRSFEVDLERNKIKSAVSIQWREDYDLFSWSDFSKRFLIDIKNKLTNLSKDMAEKYLNNLQEIASVKIILWPPFINKLPKIWDNIDILEYKWKLQ